MECLIPDATFEIDTNGTICQRPTDGLIANMRQYNFLSFGKIPISHYLKKDEKPIGLLTDSKYSSEGNSFLKVYAILNAVHEQVTPELLKEMILKRSTK